MFANWCALSVIHYNDTDNHVECKTVTTWPTLSETTNLAFDGDTQHSTGIHYEDKNERSHVFKCHSSQIEKARY